MTIELPIACSLEEKERQDRVAEWGSLMTDAVIHREATDTGVRLLLQASNGTRQRLDELIALESKCCEWMTFEVSGAGPLTVEITADEEFGGAAIRELFLADFPGER
jgi:hypothetical protein